MNKEKRRGVEQESEKAYVQEFLELNITFLGRHIS